MTRFKIGLCVARKLAQEVVVGLGGLVVLLLTGLVVGTAFFVVFGQICFGLIYGFVVMLCGIFRALIAHIRHLAADCASVGQSEICGTPGWPPPTSTTRSF